jgi:hypothetical protein
VLPCAVPRLPRRAGICPEARGTKREWTGAYRVRKGMTEKQSDETTGPTTPPAQPEPEASSDGDGSWTEDPQTQDPDENRSVEEVVRRTAGS